MTEAVQASKNSAVPTEFFMSFDSMPLEESDQPHLRAAHGYIELGLFEEERGGGSVGCTDGV